ncbi:MAG: DUF4136 domain-containing protein [Novosphingobium sp.]
MRKLAWAVATMALGALAGCVAPVGPVQVTRFHDAALASSLGQGTIAVEPAAGIDPESLELRTYQVAVARQLRALGYSESDNANSNQIALVRVSRSNFQPGRNGSPVSVGVGGGTSSYGSGVGLGVGFDLSGPPPEQIATELAVQIRDRASDKTLWEGRATFTVKATSPLADTQLGAAKMAQALFAGFPGNSGETVEVK